MNRTWDAYRHSLKMNSTRDDRSKYTDYLQLDATFFCPFSGPPTDGIAANPGNRIYISYEIYYGTPIDQNDSNTNFNRITDTPTYNGEQFDVILADLDQGRDSGNEWRRMATPIENATHVKNALDSYYLSNSYAREPTTRNFVFSDGHVTSLTQTQHDFDSRLTKIPHKPNLGNNVYGFIPSK